MSATTVPTVRAEKTVQRTPPWINFPELSASPHSPQWVSVFHVLNWSPWQVDVVKGILQFQSLRDNWDSYGSRPPSFDVILAASRLILNITLDDPPKPRIVPVPGGGIQFEWEKGRRELEIEVRPDGSIEYLKIEGGHPIGDGEELGSAGAGSAESLLSWLVAG